MLIIPAIDMINGECVRLSKGDYSSKNVYEKNPLLQAQKFEDIGLTHLHLVDLDGAKCGSVQNWKVIETLCSKTKLKIDFGGGVKTTKELELLFELGVDKVTCGSIAVKNKELVLDWLSIYKDKLILGADCQNYLIKTSGWLEANELEVTSFVKDYFNKGFKYCISTDIAQDGMMKGPSFALYNKLQQAVPNMLLIASGGISCFSDLLQLKAKNLYGTIVGKAYYEGVLSLEEMGRLNNAC